MSKSNNKKKNISAKDIAFEKERNRLRKQKRKAEEDAYEKANRILELEAQVEELESMIIEKDAYISKLLELSKMSEEDLKVMVESEKKQAEAAAVVKHIFGGGLFR